MKLGFRSGTFLDETRPDWDGEGKRPIAWSLWYPATDDAQEEELRGRSWFKRPAVARDAPILASAAPYPLVLLSHGTGGSAAGLEWLAQRLVRLGFVAIGVNHHGNTGSEPYRAEGFACLWERARDLSILLDHGEWREGLSGQIDEDKIFAAGFSAGAYSVMLLVGAVVQFSQFEPSRLKPGRPRGPREFPDLADHVPRLLETSATFRESWSRMSLAYRDTRIKAALVCAPGRSVLGFTEASLSEIDVPTLIVVGDGDVTAPVEECSVWLHQRLAHNRLEILAGGAAHSIFLPEGSAMGFAFAGDLFTDPEGIDRPAVHDHVATMAGAFFRAVRAGD